MQWLFQAPAQRLRIHGREDSSPSDSGIGDVPYVSSLSPNPNKLNSLWNEYEVEIGGKKPEKACSPLERGPVM